MHGTYVLRLHLYDIGKVQCKIQEPILKNYCDNPIGQLRGVLILFRAATDNETKYKPAEGVQN